MPNTLHPSPSATFLRTPCTCARHKTALTRANAAIDLFEQKTRPTFRQCCAIEKASETLTRKLLKKRHGSNGEARKPPDPVAQVLSIMRRMTAAQRLEAAKQLGDENLMILASLEAELLNGVSADQAQLPL